MAKKLMKKSFRGKVKRTAEKRESAKSGFSYLKLPNGVSQYKPTPGKTEKFNIVPYIVKSDRHPDLDKAEGMALKGDAWFQLPFKVHSNVGAGDASKAVVCPTTFGERCPICEYAAKRAKAGADWEEVKEYRPKDRILYAIQEVETKTKNDTEYSVLDMSHYLFQKYLTDELAENEENECYADLEGGKTLKVRWKEEKFGKNTYAECGRIDFLDRDDLEESVLEDAPCLDEILKVLSYDDLEKLFLQGEVDEDSDDDTDDKDSDEDEDETPFKGEEEETPKPKKKAPVKKAPVKKATPEPQLTWEDLEEMEISELLEVAEFHDIEVDVEEEDEDIIRTAIAEELDIKKPLPKKKAPAPKKTPKKEKPEPTKVEFTWDDVQDMELEELQEIAEEHNIDIDGIEDEDDIRDAITDALDL